MGEAAWARGADLLVVALLEEARAGGVGDVERHDERRELAGSRVRESSILGCVDEGCGCGRGVLCDFQIPTPTGSFVRRARRGPSRWKILGPFQVLSVSRRPGT